MKPTLDRHTAPKAALSGAVAAGRNGFSSQGVDATPVVRASRLAKSYLLDCQPVVVLQDIDLVVRRGEIVAVFGPSGCGKSTLLNLLGGLDRPTSGTVELEGRLLDVGDQQRMAELRRHEVGFVFQSYNLLPSLSALENVALATELAGSGLEPGDALGEVGLEHRAQHFPGELSGGEQQRVALARAIAKRPRILLCDEPTGALDDEATRAILCVLEKLRRTIDLTVVITSHDPEVAAAADRVLRIQDGRLVETWAASRMLEPVDLPTQPCPFP